MYVLQVLGYPLDRAISMGNDHITNLLQRHGATRSWRDLEVQNPVLLTPCIRIALLPFLQLRKVPSSMFDYFK